MKVKILISVLLVLNVVSDAQVMVEISQGAQTRDGALLVYGSDNLQHSIPYDRIKGTPYWNTNWLNAFLFDQRDTLLGKYKAKFNFATNEVHYVDKKGKEQVAIPGTINGVVFMKDDDSTQIATVFRMNISDIKSKMNCKLCFIQELNQGQVKLLKVTRRLLKTQDSLFGTLKSYYFYDDTQYFVQHGELYDKMKRLNKDAVFSFVPGASEYNEWIKENGLRFNKEEDYLVFLNHYNSSRKKE